MRPGLSPIPVAATVLLHAAIVAAIVAHLSGNKSKPAEPVVISVQLLSPPAPPLPQASPSLQPSSPPSPITQPTAPAPSAPPPAAPAMPAEKKPVPKSIPKPRAQARPRATPPADEAKAPDKPSASKLAIPDIAPPAANAPAEAPSSSAPTADSAAPASSSAPAAQAPPARTAVSDASYAATNRKPPYPALSRRYGEQGTVVLRVLVKPDGTAGTVELRSSSGYPLLDESARTTVQTWRFNPATVDGKPVAEWYQVSIPFKLQD